MKNVRNLQLKDVEALTDIKLMSTGCGCGSMQGDGTSAEKCMPYVVYDDMINRGISIKNV
ncbi:MAG: hypothetical protein LBV43_05610 [Prevotella sp.]|jgi:hypothetical protein|nr:hypothetical protein [Prevotella sp.]